MPEAAPALPREHVAGAISKLWWFPLVRGILLLILGGYALFRPGMTLIVFTQIVGLFVVIDGVFSIIAGIMGAVPSRGWVILRGVIEIIIGAFVLAHPILVAGVTATVLIYMLAIAAILFGILEIVAAIRDRKAIEGEGWIILSGVIMLLFGALLLLAPLSFGLLIVRILGIFAIIAGILLIVFAFRLRGLGHRLKGSVT